MNHSASHRDDPSQGGGIADKLRRNWKWLLPGAAVVVGVVAWLAFAFFGIQTLFLDDEVSETGPVFESGAAQTDQAVVPDPTAETEDEAGDPTAPEAATPESEGEDPEAVADDAPQIVTLAEGSFGPRAHPAEGTALVLNDGTDQRFLRFEDFATDNGPDLNVYLTRADADASDSDFDREGDYVDLGDLKGNIGPQNYEIPADVDLSEFDTVVIWCVRFSVSFGSADLTLT